jgi:hypothetical protein
LQIKREPLSLMGLGLVGLVDLVDLVGLMDPGKVTGSGALEGPAKTELHSVVELRW